MRKISILSLFFIIALQNVQARNTVRLSRLPDGTKRTIKRLVADGESDSIQSAIPILDLITERDDGYGMIWDFCKVEDSAGRSFIQNLVRHNFTKRVQDLTGWFESFDGIDGDLLFAAQSDEMVKLLSEHGARHKKDADGKYPCEYSSNVQPTLAHYQLLQAYEENNGEKALQALKHGAGPEGPFDWARKISMARVIKSSNSDVRPELISNWVATTIFQQSCKDTNFESAKLALHKGADSNCRINGVHFLIWLLQRKKYQLAEYVVHSDFAIAFNEKDYIKLKMLRDMRAKKLLNFLL